MCRRLGGGKALCPAKMLKNYQLPNIQRFLKWVLKLISHFSLSLCVLSLWWHIQTHLGKPCLYSQHTFANVFFITFVVCNPHLQDCGELFLILLSRSWANSPCPLGPGKKMEEKTISRWCRIHMSVVLLYYGWNWFSVDCWICCCFYLQPHKMDKGATDCRQRFLFQRGLECSR